MFGLKMVRFGSPDLRTGALGVKRVRGTVSPYSRGRAGPKKAHFGQNSKFDPRSTFRGDLFLGRSIFRERCVRKLPMLQNSPDSARKRVFNRHAVRHVQKLPNLQNFPESSCPVGLRQCCRQTTWRPKREISILIVLSSTTDHPQSVKIFQSLVFW